MSIGGNIGAAEGYKAEAKVHLANARVARAQGRAARGQAYGQAARVELENEVAGQQAVQNMERLREKETQARGSVQAARGATGFTAQGSGSKAEVSVLEAFEQKAQDMAYSRALQDTSARFGAAMARKSGDLFEMGANVEADYTAAQAEISKIKKVGAYSATVNETVATVIGAIFGGPAGAMMGSSMAQSVNRGFAGSVESQGGGNKEMQRMGSEQMGNFIYNKLGSWLS